MEIIRKSGELSKREIYQLSRSPEIMKMRDHVGEVIDVDKYLVYQDQNGTGEEVTVLSIMSSAGAVYATNSKTAMGEFEAIDAIMDGEPYSVKVIEGVSKSGRNYITLALV